MFKTLAEAKADDLKTVAGSCPNSADFLRILNKSVRQLMIRGDWKGTVVPIHVCIKRGCVVWPRYVAQVRKLNYCRTMPLPINGLWWSFLNYDTYHTWCPPHSPTYHVHGGQYTAVQQDLMGNRLVRAYPDARKDIDDGKTVTIFGLDENGQPLRTRQHDGSYTDGVVITLAAPFGSTSVFVSRIDRVLKDATTGMVRLFAYDATLDVLEDVAVYEPSETNPQYVRQQVHMPCTCGTHCGDSKAVLALVKLQFVPASADTDLVLIQNLDALKDFIQSIKAKEANNTELAAQFEASAIRELNLELQDAQADDQLPVSIEPLKGYAFGNRCF